MKAIIISDTHGYTDEIHDIIEKENDADALFFLGDGANDLANIELLYPQLKMYKVLGNCDFRHDLPGHAYVTIDGVNIFYTHGHLYYVKRHFREIVGVAKHNDAHIVMFGHTHIPFCDEVKGITLFNPGAVSGNRGGKHGCGYGVLIISNGNFTLSNYVL